ncbi:MAG: hypothetical protein OSJ22_01370, partial [Rikenellaceae bacterium]|nr:hypothetical protein [Rikenellaceae bacterium]
RGCTHDSNTKTYPTKINETKAEIQRTSNYTKHNCKDKAQKVAQQQLIKNAIRRITIVKAPERSEWHKRVA